MAKKATSLTHPAHAGTPILEGIKGVEDPKAKAKAHAKNKAKKQAKEGLVAEVKDAKAQQEAKRQGKKKKPDGKSSRGGIKRANKRTPLRLQRWARDEAALWEALVYGSLKTDEQGHLIFVEQETVMMNGRWVKRGGYPLRKAALCTQVDEAWSEIPQAVLLKALSSYDVFKMRAYATCPYGNKDKAWGQTFIWWNLTFPLYEAGLTLRHCYQVFGLMLDYGLSAREALIFWKQGRNHKAILRLAPMRTTHKVRHFWAKAMAKFAQGEQPSGVREGHIHEQWVIREKIALRAY